MKNKIKITKNNIIRNIAKQTNKNICEIKEIYDVLESLIFDYLHSVNEQQDVSIKLFEGIVLDGKFIAKKEKQNNLTGEVGFVESKIKPKFNITRSYCEKLNK